MKASGRGQRGKQTEQQTEPLDFDAVLTLVPGRWPDPSILRQEELELVALIDGTRPISELLWLSGLSTTVVFRTLRTLAGQGIIAPFVPGEGTGDNAHTTHAPAPPSGPHPADVPGNLEPPPAAGSPGKDPADIGAYEVICRIAQGGFGSVYLCRRSGAGRFQRLFTLKAIRQHAPEAAAAEQSFLREADLGSLLHHPNLLPVLDVGSYQGQPFLILDYVEGASLADLMLPGQPSDPALVTSVMLDVLRGLQAAHDLVDGDGRPLGLVHGDVSPPNILVGTDGAARLADFGSARLTTRPGAPADAAATMVKPAYMAPEQLHGEPVDARTDLFSAGVVLWSALTGQPLFAEPTYEQTVMNILRKKVPPPSGFGAPHSLDEICARALSRTREGRYQSAEEMAQALLEAALVEGRRAGGREVGRWVQSSVGDMLAERRRRIRDIMTGTAPATVVSSRYGTAERRGREAEDDRKRRPGETQPLPVSGPVVGLPSIARSAADETTDPTSRRRGSDLRSIWLAAMLSAVGAALATVAAMYATYGR